MTDSLSLIKPKSYHKPLVWKATHELVVETAKRWGMSVIAAYHVMAEVASKFETAEECVAAPELRSACEAFVEAWEKSHQLEKTDVAYRMALDALAHARGRERR